MLCHGRCKWEATLGAAGHTLRVTFTSADDRLPDPRALIEGVDWAVLRHARGSAEDAPAVLNGLLADDPSRQARALRYLYDPVHHQNTLYSATAPAALYVAVVLKDPRTATVLSDQRHGRSYLLRAVLLDWLGSVADEVGNEAEATSARIGFSLEGHLESASIRALRPALFRAVNDFLDNPDSTVRDAAVAASIPLLDAPELAQHRAALAPLVRDILTSSDNRAYRAAAARGLIAWGEDGRTLSATSNPDAWVDGCSSEPPF